MIAEYPHQGLAGAFTNVPLLTAITCLPLWPMLK